VIQHWPSTGPALAQHWPSTGPALAQRRARWPQGPLALPTTPPRHRPGRSSPGPFFCRKCSRDTLRPRWGAARPRPFAPRTAVA